MADIKTKPTAVRPLAFIDKLKNEQARMDCRELVKLMSEISGKPAQMWGTSIVGFGKYFYKYESGREGEMCMIGFSPRSQNLTLYLGAAAMEDEAVMARLGKHKRSKGCLYIKRLEEVDKAVLRKLIKTSVAAVKKNYRTE